jgi:phage gpG-like protein
MADATGFDELLEALARLERELTPGENKDLLYEIGGEAAKCMDEKFQERRAGKYGPGGYKAPGAMGQPWAELAPATVAKKGHNTILEETRELVGSIDFEVQGDVVVVGTRIDKYPPYMQEGTNGRDGKGAVPARPFVTIDDGDLKRIGERAAKHLEAVLGG